MPYPRFRRARSFKFASRSSGDLTINSTTWTTVDSGLDLTLEAQTGDVIQCGLYGRASSVSGTYFVLDFHTLVSGTAINSVVTGGAVGTSPATSSPAWGRQNVPSTPTHAYLAGEHYYAVQAADISSNQVTVRVRAVSGGAVVLYASDPQFKISVQNLGPVDPN